jgi:ribonuclease P protein component
MLPLANRLKKKKDIDRVFANRKSSKSGPLICKAALNDLNVVRFCFVVSKRISNKAVVRNRLKRRLRDAAAKLLSRAKKDRDCVLIACPGLETKEFGELCLLMERVLFSAGVL